ncbi:2-nitropropane dioxygenase [Colletotrichum acutatum]
MVAAGRGREQVSSAVAGLEEEEEGLPRGEEVQNVREEKEQEVMQDVAAAAGDAVVGWNRTSRGVRGWRRAWLLRARAQAREKREGLAAEVTGEPRSRTPSRGAWQRYSAPSSPETKSAFDAERYYHQNPLNRRLPDLISSKGFTCFLLHLLLLFRSQTSSHNGVASVVAPEPLLTRSRDTEQIRTPITDLFKIKHPILLAGMNVAAGPKLAAAVTNAGGLGVIGGVGYTPDMLKEQIAELKEYLVDKNAPFGVDLLLPQVGGSARKTNYDYTKGKLDQLVDIIIESGAKLFVSAVGVPPKHVVDRLHAAGIVYMNMIGHPKHVQKCLDLGVDIICAQGGEGGGHTGDVPTTVLIPAVVDLCKNTKSPLLKGPVQVIAAGGIHNGQLLAAALMMGAGAVWVGTRFILTDEAGAPEAHKEAVRTAGHDDNIKTLIFTGRPLRVRKNPYIENWETERQQEIKELTAKGVIPYEADLEKLMNSGDGEGSGESGSDDNAAEVDIDDALDQFRPFLMGKAAAVCNEKKPAKAVMDEFVNDAVAWLQKGNKMIAKL